MSKELEGIKCIVAIHFGALGFLNPIENEQILKDRDRVLNALNELQSIKEANPSEALKSLKELRKIANMYCSFNGTQCEHNKELADTIEKALIKVEKEHNSTNLLMQELDCKDFADLRKYARCGYEKINKQYLKFDDLKFKKKIQEMKVKIGNTEFRLQWCCIGVKNALLSNEAGYTIAFDEEQKQFFNDLRIEVIKNE